MPSGDKMTSGGDEQSAPPNGVQQGRGEEAKPAKAEPMVTDRDKPSEGGTQNGEEKSDVGALGDSKW